jgi:hypothetical protein
MRESTVWISCLALLALHGCGAFEASHPEGYLVYEPGADALRLVEIGTGLHAGNDAKAAAALADFLAGRRIYPPDGGLLTYDLDAAEGPAEAEELGPLDPSDRFVARIAKLVTVRERGLYAGEEEGLGFWRVSDFAPAKEVLAAIDEFVSQSVIEELSTPPAEGEEEFALWRDPESRELWLARARAGGPWVSLDGGRLVVDLPISTAGAAPALREIVQDSQDEEIRWFLGKVWRMEITAGGVRLWLGTAAGPMIHFGGGPWADGSPAQVDEGLHQAVSQATLPVANPEVIASLRERYGLPIPKKAERGILELARVAPQDREGLSVLEIPWWDQSESAPLTVVAPLERFRVQEAKASSGAYGEPAIGFLVASDDLPEFGRFTEQHVGRRVAFIVGGKVVMAPAIMEPLRGWGSLTGNLSEAMRDEILRHLRPR